MTGGGTSPRETGLARTRECPPTRGLIGLLVSEGCHCGATSMAKLDQVDEGAMKAAGAAAGLSSPAHALLTFVTKGELRFTGW